MSTVLLVVHLLLALALVGVILIQRSEGGGLGIGGGSSGGFMTTRGTANLLTRATGVLAALFMATSLALAILASQGRTTPRSILDLPAAPAGAPVTTPAQPAAPSVPLAR
jgi:preprotein translocase subunit SecG